MIRKIKVDVWFDTIEIDGSSFKLKEAVFVDIVGKDEININQTLSGRVLNIAYRERKLTGVKKLLFAILNKFNIYSCESNKIVVAQLRYAGIIN